MHNKVKFNLIQLLWTVMYNVVLLTAFFPLKIPLNTPKSFSDRTISGNHGVRAMNAYWIVIIY